MQQMAEALTRKTQGTGSDELREATKTFAVYALDAYSGELLARALRLCRASADFLNELEAPGHAD